jgi:hypothetical protein
MVNFILGHDDYLVEILEDCNSCKKGKPYFDFKFEHQKDFAIGKVICGRARNKILFKKSAAIKIIFLGRTHYLLSSEDILMHIEGTGNEISLNGVKIDND